MTNRAKRRKRAHQSRRRECQRCYNRRYLCNASLGLHCWGCWLKAWESRAWLLTLATDPALAYWGRRWAFEIRPEKSYLRLNPSFPLWLLERPEIATYYQAPF